MSKKEVKIDKFDSLEKMFEGLDSKSSAVIKGGSRFGSFYDISQMDGWFNQITTAAGA